jgi:hypothetical protein
VKHGERSTAGQGRRIDLEDASRRARELARPKRTSRAPARRFTQPAARDRARNEPGGGRGESACLRCAASRRSTSGPGPREVMATTASCMESSMAASSWRRLSISAKLWPSRSAVWLRAPPWRRVHRCLKHPGARSGRPGQCGAQRQPRAAGVRSCAGGPGGHGQRNGQARSDRPTEPRGQGKEERSCRVRETTQDQLHCHGLKDKQQDEQPSSFEKYFAVNGWPAWGVVARPSRSWGFRSGSRRRALS